MIDTDENNILEDKKEDEMSNLLQKLDNQIEENKKRSVLNLPSYDIDLDLNMDIDFSPVININNNTEKNNDRINIEVKLKNKNEGEEKLNNKNILENMILNESNNKVDENNNLKISEMDDINNNLEINKKKENNEDTQINKVDKGNNVIRLNQKECEENNKSEEIKKENEVNNKIDEIKKENEDDNKIDEIKKENEDDNKNNEIKKENEDMKKSQNESKWDLINSSKEKIEEEKNNINNNELSNNNLSDHNIKKENYSEDDNNNNNNLEQNNNNIPKIEELNKEEKKETEKEVNKKNSESSIYEDLESIGEQYNNKEIQEENNNKNNSKDNIEDHNNNIDKENSKNKIVIKDTISEEKNNKNNNNNKEQSKNQIDIKESISEEKRENNNNDNKNESNFNINENIISNNVNNINNSNNDNDNNSQNETIEIVDEEISPEIEVEKKSEEKNKNKGIIITNKEKKEDKNQNEISSGLDISEPDEKKSEKSNKEPKLAIQSVPPSMEIQQVPQRDSIEDKHGKNIGNIKAGKSVDDFLDEDKKKLRLVLDEVTNFRKEISEFNKEDLKQFPVIKLDFNYQEKTLDDLIPTLPNKLEENETLKEVEKRKNNFMNHIYFEGNIITNPLLQIVPDCKIWHIDLMNKIYNEQGLKNIPKISEDNYEKIIFSSEEKNTINNTKIDEVDNLNNFLYKYHLENNEEIAMKSYKYFPYWRCVESDGNSFFRTTMFAIIENFIIKKMIEQLNQLISEITCDRFIQIYKENNINYEIPFYIFGVIIYLLENNKIEEAYSVLVKSYSLKDDSFDKILIIYLRNICFDYTKESLELIKDEEIMKKYPEKIVPNPINTELIKTMNIEPDFFMVCLMSYLFDINIVIYWLDRDLLKPKEGLIKLTDEEVPDLPFISIGYFFSSFHRIYWRKWVEEEPIIEKIFSNKAYEMKKLTYEVKNNKKCQNCKSDKFILFTKKKILVCKNCLEDYINEISISRKEALIKDYYNGKEYYSRSMRINDDYLLNDYEFIEVKEEYNMINYLQQKLSVECSKCKNFFTKRNLNNLKCKCLLCDNCLDEMIIQTTNGKKILNVYEKNHLNKMSCSVCGGSFSYEDAIDHLKNIKQSDKDNAIKRMAEYAITLCLICGEKVREKYENDENDTNNNIEKEEEKEKEKYTEIKKYKKIKLKREGERNKGIDYIDTEHVICFDCFEKNKINNVLDISSSDEDENNSHNKYYINYAKGDCFCRICNKKHILMDKNVKNSACCTTSACSLS